MLQLQYALYPEHAHVRTQPTLLQQGFNAALNWGLGRLGSQRIPDEGYSGPSGLTGYPASTVSLPPLPTITRL